MYKTFKAKYAKDRALDKVEDLKRLRENMNKQHMIPHQLTEDENNWIFAGVYSCTCEDKYDKAYCDEERSSCSR